MWSPRTKTKRVDKGAFDLLHSGVRRNVPREDYTKIFTKIPIAQPKRPSFLPSPHDTHFQLQDENERLRS